MLYAAEDSEIEFVPITNLTVEQMQPLMQQWFYNLIELSWLRLMADRGDDMLKRWLSGTSYVASTGNIEDLEAAFRKDEQIFAMLLGVRFRSEDKKLSMRMNVRNRQK